MSVFMTALCNRVRTYVVTLCRILYLWRLQSCIVFNGAR